MPQVINLSALFLALLGRQENEGHFGNAKRLEYVQLAGAVVKRGCAESGSKLRALQTLRARGRPHRTTIDRRTYVHVPEYLVLSCRTDSLLPVCGKDFAS
jgi:hypothetical protein